MCTLIHVFPSYLLLLVQVFGDVVGGLPVIISRHLSVLVNLFNKLVVVVALACDIKY